MGVCEQLVEALYEPLLTTFWAAEVDINDLSDQ